MVNSADFERIVLERSRERYVLRLYVTGMAPRSTRAVATIKRICDEMMPGEYDLEVIDLYQNPGRAREEQVIAAPTLVKESPKPVRRLIGDLSNEARLLGTLNLRPQE
jgi:circadian clock protein KaiB